MTSIVATFLVAYFISTLTVKYQKLIIATVKKPNLYISIFRDTDEKNIALVIQKIFTSWNTKNVEDYIACWSDDAVKIISSNTDKKFTKAAIKGKFIVSCETYSSISTEYLVFNDIRVNYPEMGLAIVDVNYRFLLISKESSLPVIEDTNELYVLENDGKNWKIKANHDHFVAFSPRNPDLG